MDRSWLRRSVTLTACAVGLLSTDGQGGSARKGACRPALLLMVAALSCAAVSSVNAITDNLAGCPPGFGGADCSLQLESLQQAPNEHARFMDPLGGGSQTEDAVQANAVPSQLRKMLQYAQHLEATRKEGQDLQVRTDPLDPVLGFGHGPGCRCLGVHHWRVLVTLMMVALRVFR